MAKVSIPGPNELIGFPTPERVRLVCRRIGDAGFLLDRVDLPRELYSHMEQYATALPSPFRWRLDGIDWLIQGEVLHMYPTQLRETRFRFNDAKTGERGYVQLILWEHNRNA